jgi:hypothetical protein
MIAARDSWTRRVLYVRTVATVGQPDHGRVTRLANRTAVFVRQWRRMQQRARQQLD